MKTTKGSFILKKPSFLSFLKNYLRYLGDCRSLALPTLVQLGSTDYPRVVEPLYFYAIETDQLGRLLRLSEGMWFYDDYLSLSKRFESKEELLNALDAHDASIPLRYRKIYLSYKSERDKTANDKAFAQLARIELLEQLAGKGISKYRVYTDLNLNPGNINRYLKHGDTKNISRQTVNKVLRYVREAEAL
jgi:hypothetical protein